MFNRLEYKVYKTLDSTLKRNNMYLSTKHTLDTRARVIDYAIIDVAPNQESVSKCIIHH